MSNENTSPYGILFTPVEIGPVTAPNRFYQVPHCTGLGHIHPHAEAAHRQVKAEGGWGVICTQEAEIHPSSEIWPSFEARIWDDRDIPTLQLTTDAVHQHGSLAGIEFVYGGRHTPNRYSRIAPMAPSDCTVNPRDPLQARAMTKRDIRTLRQWYVAAAKRAKLAGFDIVYVYAGHDMSILHHFLTPRHNQRSDEYGGSLKNRIRLVRETLIDVKEAVGDTCGVAFRFAVDELMGEHGMRCEEEGREVVELLSDIPDLWDVNISGWSNDSATARFEPQEGYQQPFTEFVKSITSKPVVAVGRFTSPDAMVARIQKGVLDFIGAARPSIADPWMPKKIRENRIDDIRECIGCNICVTSDNLNSPLRCTQNPTAGEEWRRDWHPEVVPQISAPRTVLVVGAGPAGLECALQLGHRGVEVFLAEASGQAGGRVLQESQLPGLSSWARVRDYRLNQILQMNNVQLLLDNHLNATDCAEFECDHIVIATGSEWRRDGRGRQHAHGLSLSDDSVKIMTPDDIMRGNLPAGKVVVYDDDHYYMAGVIAEHCAESGCDVTVVTPAPNVSAWTEHTLELEKIQRRLYQCGVALLPLHRISCLHEGEVVVEHLYSNVETRLSVDSLCMVTSRAANQILYQELVGLQSTSEVAASSVVAIGDCHAPSTIAAAVFSGHFAARNMGVEPADDPRLFQRHFINLELSE